MSVTLNRVRGGFYLDSVALMRASRGIAALPGVEEAAMMMGTPANKTILEDARLLATEGLAAAGGDLVIAIRAGGEDEARAALAEAESLISRPAAREVKGANWRPRGLRAAVAAAPEANLALISVPGDFAAAEARKALRRGLHVMLFSDNVPLAQERALKEEARALGLLVMGPDCGTAILNGVPLAFANVVPRGDIAIVGASGTGTQEVACLIAQAGAGGSGISQAIGVGGRDLKAEVGGITTLMALDALDEDPATRHIVLVSKPPSDDVLARVIERIERSAKSFTLCCIGARPMSLPANARQATTLAEAAALALAGETGGALGEEALTPRLPTGPLPEGAPRVRGLFAGGTLCAEAQVVFLAAGEPVASNAAIPGVSAPGADARAHLMLDLGDDDYTRGRPHPMIEPGVRDDPLREALADPSVGLLLLDLVIGTGAHPDPAARLVESLSGLERGGKAIVASVTGTEADPQVRSRQVAGLEAAGIRVAPSNAAAAALALALLAEPVKG